MLFDVMNVINQAIISCSSWFVNVFNSSGVEDIYLAMLFVVFAVRFLISPFVGAATFTAASDRVRNVRETNRRKGKFERNQKGKYAK